MPVLPDRPAAVSLADQTFDQLGGRGSILVRQRRDHARLEQLLHQVARTVGEAQDAALRDLARLVFPHAFAEESVLWPVIRRHLPDGESITLQVELEHQQINALWTRLEVTDHDDPARAELLTDLATLLRQDARDEEDDMLPRLQAAVDQRTLRRLGAAWAAVDAVAPTRPHPTVARRPPGNALAALPLTVLDRTRDRVDGAATHGPGAWRSAAVTVSRVLGRAAGRVERAGVFRVGEDPSTSVERGAPG